MNKLFQHNNSKHKQTLYDSWSFSNTNYVLFFAGIAIIIVGYFLMSFGEVNSFQSLTLAPILLFIGYIVLIPAALIFKSKQKELGS